MRRSRLACPSEGGLLFELLIGVAFCIGVSVLFCAVAWGLTIFGWPMAGRAAAFAPIWGIGLVNLWIAWRPGDAHEAAPIMRVSAVIRGLAMVVPAAMFIATPESVSGLGLVLAIVVGMGLSFAVLALDRRPADVGDSQ